METMICIGDSLTEGTDIPVDHAWPSLVAKTLHLKVINRGIGGDTTAGMLARFYPDVVADKPAFVFILGGTNDLWWGWKVNTVVGNLFSMVVQARYRGLTPILGIPFPVDTAAARRREISPPWEGYDRLTAKMTHLRDTLADQAAEYEVTVVDLQGPFLSGKGNVRSDLYLADGLHPSEAGHRLIAETIGACLSERFGFAAVDLSKS